MITRSLIDYGHSMLVCLPKYWLERAGWKKGDRIPMKITKKGYLLIRSKDEETSI